jgi:hypothetical protein
MMGKISALFPDRMIRLFPWKRALMYFSTTRCQHYAQPDLAS